MRFIYLFDILVLFLIENRMWKVLGLTNLNVAELEHLSKRMNPIECKKLLDAIHLKSSNNYTIDNKYHDSLIGMTEIDCRLNLKEWNHQYQGEKNGESRQIMSEALRSLGRLDLANDIKSDKQLVVKSNAFFKYKINRTINPRMKNNLKRSNLLSKTKIKKEIKTEPGIGHITSGVRESDTSAHHGAIEIPHSMVHSVLMNGIDDKIAQLLLERRKEFDEKYLNDDKEMSSKRWIAFIIFLLFIIMTMFITAMITICKNRGHDRHRYNREAIINKECDDNCPLMNYSSMSPDIDQGWTTSSMDSTMTKPHAQLSVSEINWPTVIPLYEEEEKNLQNSKIIMKDKQEQTHKLIKVPKSQVKKSELKKPKKRKRKKYKTRSEKLIDDISIREKIFNSFRKNKDNCNCYECNKDEGNEIYTDDQHDGENETRNLTDLNSSPRKMDSEVEETPIKEEQLHEQIHEEKKNSSNKIETMTSKSPRLSFPMACTNKDCHTGSLTVKCDNTGGKRSF